MSAIAHMVTALGEHIHSGPWTPFMRDTSPLHPWFLGAFLFGGLLAYFLTARSLSLKKALGFVFSKRIYRHESTRMDLWSYLINYSLFIPSFGVLAAMLWTGNSLYEWMVASFGGPIRILAAGWSIIAAQFFIMWVAEDFSGFMFHYFFHKVPALWRLHRNHHSAEVLNPLTANRNHPLEQAFQVLVIGPVFGLIAGVTMYLTGGKFGATMIALLAAWHFAKNLLQNFRHSHIWISYGRSLDRFFISPSMHIIHHSALPQHRDKNMGQFLTLWDRLFGTLYVPECQEENPLGISLDEIGENNPHRTLAGFYLEPVVSMMRVLFGTKTGAALAADSVPN